MTELVFVDSNILIYAHDQDAAGKRELAAGLLEELWESGNGRLSTQVLQEFFVNATSRLPTPLARSMAREVVRTYAVWARDSTTPETITRAIDIADLARLSFWDALILASAEQCGASRLLTEDLNHGQRIVGVRIENPFWTPDPE
jgi:predicted nucleic acid-binding protein